MKRYDNRTSIGYIIWDLTRKEAIKRVCKSPEFTKQLPGLNLGANDAGVTDNDLDEIYYLLEDPHYYVTASEDTNNCQPAELNMNSIYNLYRG